MRHFGKSKGWKVWVEASGKIWRCRWNGKYGTGQQTFVYKKDADDFCDQKKSDFQRHDANLPIAAKRPAPKTVGQAADDYLAYSRKEKDEGTYLRFDSPAISSIRKFLGDHRLLLDVRPTEVQSWKHTLPKTGTALMLYRQACAFFNYSVRMKYISESPAKGLKKPPEGKEGRDLTDAEIKGMLEGAPEALYRSGVFAMNTILRIGEVLGKRAFRWEWVFEIAGGLWAGRYPAELRKGRAKVKKDLIFPINTEARAAMGERRPSGPVFPWSPNTVQQQVVAQRKDKSLAGDITFHCFRHTGASRFLRAGGRESFLIKSGLWADYRSLLRYIHVDINVLAREFQALKTVLPSLSGPQIGKTRTRRRPGL